MESDKNIPPAQSESAAEGAQPTTEKTRDTAAGQAPGGMDDLAALEAARRLVNPALMFEIGPVLGSTFGITFKNLPFFFILYLIISLISLPLFFIAFKLLPETLWPIALVLLAMLLQAAITFAVYQIKTGARRSITAILEHFNFKKL